MDVSWAGPWDVQLAAWRAVPKEFVMAGPWDAVSAARWVDPWAFG